MSDKIPMNVLNAMYTGRWAIIPDNLKMLVSIANRTHSDIEAVLSKQAERSGMDNLMVRDGVAILNIFGPIIPRADIFNSISGAVSVETLALCFGEALTANNIKGIVLNIDSPGGNIVNVHEFANQIFAARGVKPIIAYTGGTCASAAYWIASAADKIVADKTAFLGSIGVVATWTDDSKAREKEGLIDYELVSSQSPRKRQDLKSKDGLATLQAELDALADIFIENIARNRGTKIEHVNENFGQGGILPAANAVNIGMADSLGSLESVISDIVSDTAKTQIFLKSKPLTKGTTIMNAVDDKRKKRTGDDPEEDENQDEESEEKKDAVDPMASLLASDPKLYNRIKQVGATEERNRIKAIHDIGNACGFSAVVRSAIFDNPISASDLALKVVKQEGSARVLVANNYKADADDIPDVPASSIADITADGINNKIVAAVVSGLKLGGHKEINNV